MDQLSGIAFRTHASDLLQPALNHKSTRPTIDIQKNTFKIVHQYIQCNTHKAHLCNGHLAKPRS